VLAHLIIKSELYAQPVKVHLAPRGLATRAGQVKPLSTFVPTFLKHKKSTRGEPLRAREANHGIV
jgi:hypothetical protein